MLRDQAPWIITFLCISAPSLLTHNSVVRLAGALEAIGYGLLLVSDYRGLAQRRPWSGALTGEPRAL